MKKIIDNIFNHVARKYGWKLEEAPYKDPNANVLRVTTQSGDFIEASGTTYTTIYTEISRHFKSVPNMTEAKILEIAKQMGLPTSYHYLMSIQDEE